MAQMDRMRPEGLPVKDRHSGPPGRDAQRTPGRPAGAPLNLIHRNKVPNPATARVSGRFRVSVQDPSGIPLQDVFRAISGELSPLEFLALRRLANESKTPR
jgi:hypothetical protein